MKKTILLTITAALIFSGCSYAGLNNPQQKVKTLVVESTTPSATVTLNNSLTSSGAKMEMNSNRDFLLSNLETGKGIKFYSSGAQRGVIDSSGRLGLGVALPVAPLHIFQSGSGAIMRLSNTSTGSTSVDGIEFNVDTAGDLRIKQLETNGTLKLTTRGVDRLHVAKDGEIGIGTTAPLANLSIKGATATQVHLTNNSTGTTIGDGLLINQAGSAVAFNNYENSDISFATNASTMLTLKNTGDVQVHNNLIATTGKKLLPFRGCTDWDGTTDKNIPAGWTLSRVTAGNYTVTHNQGWTATAGLMGYFVNVNRIDTDPAASLSTHINMYANYFTIKFEDYSTSNSYDSAFCFTAMEL